MKRKYGLLLALGGMILSTMASSSEESTNDNSVTGQVWSVQRFQYEFCGEDKWEPFNRSMFGIFDGLMTYVVDPFCYVYSSVFPKPLINGIDNFSENLEEPVHIFSSLFMGEGHSAWNSAQRFFINSTLGIGGLFDPAKNLFTIYDSGASLSDTLARWEIPAGPPLALPFIPRSSVRGHVGYVLDYAFDLKTWIDFFVPSEFFIGYTWGLVPNKAPVWRGSWEKLCAHANDGYALYMPMTAALNDFNLRQFTGYFEDVRPPVHASATRPEDLKGRWLEIDGYAPRGPSLDSLRALCFSPLGDNDFWWERRSIFNRDFSKTIDEREISLSGDLPKAVYSFIKPSQHFRTSQTSKLVFILPGIGSNRTASEAVAMAELLHAHGYAVVICDSLFHWEYVRSVNRGILPGYLTEDVRRMADYLAKIHNDLTSEGLVSNPEVSIIGWSMGGLMTAHLAAQESRGALPLRVQHFVSINPPVSMKNALASFVPVYESSRTWTKEKALQMFTEVAPRLYFWVAQEHPRYDPTNPPCDQIGNPWNYAPNLTEKQANYLLGQTMRVIFPTLIAQRHQIAPFPWLKSELTWFHRNDFYAEIGDVSMDEYMHTYVPTCYEGVSSDAMITSGNIRFLASDLLSNDKLSVIHTWNDPLENDADRQFLDNLFKDRISWFADGGHCGYFYTKPFETELLRRLAGSSQAMEAW